MGMIGETAVAMKATTVVLDVAPIAYAARL